MGALTVDKVRGTLVNLSLSLAVVVLLGLGLEGAGRLYEWRYPPPEIAGYIWDWQVEWQGDFPMATGSRDPFPVQPLNGDGFRDRWHPAERVDLVARVVCLGDSVTFGAEIAAEEAYPQVLERRLLGGGRRVDVMNAGMPGWSTRQERIAYTRILRRYRPDRVVLGVCLNDIPELQNNLSRPPGWLGALYRRSSFVRAVVGAREREIARVEELFRPGHVARNEHALSLFFEEVRGLRRDVEADGGRLSLAVFPFRFQVGEKTARPDRPAGHPGFLRPRGARVRRPATGPGANRRRRFRRLRSPQSPRRRGHRRRPPAVERPRSPARSTRTPRSAPRPSRGWLAAETRPSLRGGLETRLRTDESAGVRMAALESLIALGGAAGRQGLLSGLGDSSQAVRWRAAQALAPVSLEAPAVAALTRALASGDAYVRRFAVWKLGEIGSDAIPAVDALVALLEGDPTSDASGAAVTLGRLGAVEALPALVRELGARRRERRVEAARGLGLMGRPAVTALPRLMAALEDEDPELRAAAVQALGRIPFARADLRDAVVRRAAGFGLASPGAGRRRSRAPAPRGARSGPGAGRRPLRPPVGGSSPRGLVPGDPGKWRTGGGRGTGSGPGRRRAARARRGGPEPRCPRSPGGPRQARPRESRRHGSFPSGAPRGGASSRGHGRRGPARTVKGRERRPLRGTRGRVFSVW